MGSHRINYEHQDKTKGMSRDTQPKPANWFSRRIIGASRPPPRRLLIKAQVYRLRLLRERQDKES
jgi:hypothetical protein